MARPTEAEQQLGNLFWGVLALKSLTVILTSWRVLLKGVEFQGFLSELVSFLPRAGITLVWNIEEANLVPQPKPLHILVSRKKFPDPCVSV